MDFRRRLIALHQDERGYALQGKRGSGLVSIELKGDTADISVSAKDLVEPKNGSYIVVLYPKNAQTTPYILGEIEYKERAMQLHKILVNSSLPCDIDDFLAASVLFVGTHIDFVLVGQTECTVDWSNVKSSIRLKGTASLLSSKTLGKTQRAQSVSVQQIDPNKSKNLKAEVKPLEITEANSTQKDVAAKPEKNDMKLKDYGRAHFVDNSGDMGQELAVNAPMISSDFDSLKDIKEAKNIKESSKVFDAEIEDAKGFDYSELVSENSKDAEQTASNMKEQTEDAEVESIFKEHVEVLKPSMQEKYSKIDDIKDLDFDELLKNTDKDSKENSLGSNVDAVFKNLVAEQQEQTEEVFSDSLPLDIEDARGFDYAELLAEDKEESITETFKKAEPKPAIKANVESNVVTDENNDTEYYKIKEPIAPTVSKMGDEIEDAKGFDYSELFEESSSAEATQTNEEISASEEKAEDNEPAVASVHYDKGLEHHMTETQDGDTLESALSKGPVIKNNVRPLHDNSHLAKMTDEEYTQSLDPYGEPSDIKEAIKEDIDPCVYNKNDVRKKMNICRRYGKRLQVRPFPAMTNSVWYKVEYPGMGSSFHYLIGNVLDESGNVQVRCTAVPGPYGINPPEGLNGFTHYMTAQGMGNAGYWVSFTNPKTGRPVDAM